MRSQLLSLLILEALLLPHHRSSLVIAEESGGEADADTSCTTCARKAETNASSNDEEQETIVSGDDEMGSEAPEGRDKCTNLSAEDFDESFVAEIEIECDEGGSPIEVTSELNERATSNARRTAVCLVTASTTTVAYPGTYSPVMS